MEIVWVLVGLIVGSGIGFLVGRNKRPQTETDTGSADALEQALSETRELDRKNVELQTRLENAENVFREQKAEIQQLRESNQHQAEQVARYEAELANLEARKKELEEIREKFQKEFELIASKLLKENTSELAETNQKRLGEILNPFRDSIKDIEKKVDEAYKQEFRDKASLREEVKKLMELNQRISEEANNLTKALKGDTKKQGNWGEIVLERVLEQSGLEKGREYETQVSTQNETGKRIQPDVVVYLPENKHLIIDSKVSLVAYEHYVNAENEEEQAVYLKNHITSLENHVKGLGEKNYDTSTDLNNPDFVLLFMPIEGAFSLAVQQKPDLFNTAWTNRIVIVSPTTLLATLRTVASIWKQERQNQNVLEIARLGGSIHDKLVTVLEDLDRVDQDLDRAHNRYREAFKRLYTGKGNISTTADKIRRLGAKSTKQIDEKFLDDDIQALTQSNVD